MLSIDYFNILKEIETLFCCNTYTKYKKIDTIDRSIKLVYKKKDNIDYEYNIIIYNDINISITIPIDNSNYKYKTKIDNIENVYNYLLYHLKEKIY